MRSHEMPAGVQRACHARKVLASERGDSLHKRSPPRRGEMIDATNPLQLGAFPLDDDVDNLGAGRYQPDGPELSFRSTPIAKHELNRV